jgi:hypothetical protein
MVREDISAMLSYVVPTIIKYCKRTRCNVSQVSPTVVCFGLLCHACLSYLILSLNLNSVIRRLRCAISRCAAKLQQVALWVRDPDDMTAE